METPASNEAFFSKAQAAVEGPRIMNFENRAASGRMPYRNIVRVLGR